MGKYTIKVNEVTTEIYKRDVALAELISNYEDSIKADERITYWFGDYGINEIKYDVPNEIVKQKADKALEILGMSYSDYMEGYKKSTSDMEKRLKQVFKIQTEINKATKSVMSIVVNAFAGPSAGKTTSALLLTAELKKRGYSAEYISEYAKELVYDKQKELLNRTVASETVIFNEKKRRIDRLVGNVQFIITDSPLIQSVSFLDDKVNSIDEIETFRKMALKHWGNYNNFNYFIERDPDPGKYETIGRIDTLKEAKRLDKEILNFLNGLNINYNVYNHSTINNNSILADLIKEVKRFEPVHLARKNKCKVMKRKI